MYMYLHTGIKSKGYDLQWYTLYFSFGPKKIWLVQLPVSALWHWCTVNRPIDNPVTVCSMHQNTKRKIPNYY